MDFDETTSRKVEALERRREWVERKSKGERTLENLKNVTVLFFILTGRERKQRGAHI